MRTLILTHEDLNKSNDEILDEIKATSRELTTNQRRIIEWVKAQSFSKYADEYIVDINKLREFCAELNKENEDDKN